jgi:hypothetical protein
MEGGEDEEPNHTTERDALSSINHSVLSACIMKVSILKRQIPRDGRGGGRGAKSHD